MKRNPSRARKRSVLPSRACPACPACPERSRRERSRRERSGRDREGAGVSRQPSRPSNSTGARTNTASTRIALEIQRRSQARLPKNFCFGCGKDNAEGMKLRFEMDDANRLVHGSFRFPHRYEGPPDHLHGGIIALLADEAMGKLNRVEGIVALTAEMTVEYLRPVPLRKKITVEARATNHNGRNYWRECTIRDAHGNLLARGKGRFVKVADRIAPR